VPTAVLLSTNDVTVRQFAERDHSVVRWTEFDQGGHFLPMEQPELFGQDVREFLPTGALNGHGTRWQLCALSPSTGSGRI
jgi:pimeloyl-ACP methyl ester carboxylesterase